MRNKYTTELDNEYYMWLCGLIEVEHAGKTYWNLTRAMYLKDFRWSIPNDDNRAFEGKNLREKFCDEIGIEYVVDQFPEEVSILELIIALSYRCENIMDGNPRNGKISDWFWKMMHNVGLDRFTDIRYDSTDTDELVDQTLERIINRTYRKNGWGGLFPLNRDRKDQRKVELWYQMNAYLVENYYSSDYEII